MGNGLQSLSFRIALSWSFLLHLQRIVPAPSMKHPEVPGEGCWCSVRWRIGASLLLLVSYLFKSTFRPWVKNESLPTAQEQYSLRERGGLKLLDELSSLHASPPPLPGAGAAGVQWFTSSPPAWRQGVTPAPLPGPCAYSRHYRAAQSSAECPFGPSVAK